MEIKLVSITSPIIDELNSAEELIVYCARVSNPENQLNNEIEIERKLNRRRKIGSLRYKK